MRFAFSEDVFLMSSKDPKNPVIYAVFTTSRYNPVPIFLWWPLNGMVSHLFCWIASRRSEGADIYSAGNWAGQVISSLLYLKNTHAWYSISKTLPSFLSFTFLNDMPRCKRACLCQISWQGSISHNPLTGVLGFLSLVHGNPPSTQTGDCF